MIIPRHLGRVVANPMATLGASGKRNNVTLVKVTVTVVQSYRRLATKDDDQLLAAVAEVVHGA